MEVIVAGRAASFSNLAPGTFFKVLRDPPFFGFCVTDGNQNGALIFAPNRHQVNLPWLALGGLPQDPLIQLGDAHMRLTSESAIATMHAVPAVGEVIDASGQFYIRASHPTGGQAMFDLETGKMIANLPTGGAAVSYRRWEVGHFVDDAFRQLFSHSVP